MPQEIEIKLKLDDPAALTAALQSAGAHLEAEVLEENHIFDSADGSLRQQGSALRIRRFTGAKDVHSHAVVTFKGPRQPGEMKTREEIEFEVAEPSDALDLFRALGYVETLVFEKRRAHWRVQHCYVDVDEVPHLGHFVEIEGPDEHAIHQVRQGLGLDAIHAEDHTYVHMLVDYCKANNRPPEVRFRHVDDV